MGMVSLMTLNGWQRLWVVLSVALLLPATLMAWASFPTMATYRIELRSGVSYELENSIDADPTQLCIQLIKAYLPTLAPSSGDEIPLECLPPMPPGATPIASRAGDVVPCADLPPDLRNSASSCIDPSKVQRDAPMIVKITRDSTALWLQRARVSGVAAVLWAATCALLYLVGWSIVWIRRGFAVSR